MGDRHSDWHKLEDPGKYEIRHANITDIALVRHKDDSDITPGEIGWAFKFQDGADQFRAVVNFHSQKEAPYWIGICQLTGMGVREWRKAEEEIPVRAGCDWQDLWVERWYVTEIAGQSLIGAEVHILVSKVTGRVAAFYGDPDGTALFAHAEQISRAASQKAKAAGKIRLNRVDKRQQVADALEADPGATATAIWRSVGGDRNKVFALVRELRTRAG